MMLVTLPGRKVYPLVLGLIVHTLSPILQAEVITDGSVGPAQRLTGPDFSIPQSLGHTVGTNLFHSFDSFSLTQAESATFTGTDNIQNVISRVTGGRVSSIDGVLNSHVGQANFYFINPAGVVFGANAQVNVPGDFHVSTANELHFEDGLVFNTLHPEASTLSMAVPTEFGFLNDQSAAIRIEGSQLIFTADHSVSLSSNTISMTDGLIQNQNGTVHVQASDQLYIQDSCITTTGNRLGHIAIHAGEADILSSRLLANTGGDTPIFNETGIAIEAQSLRLENTEIHSVTHGTEDAGAIILSTQNDMKIVGSTIFSVAGKESTGDTGSIELMAGGALSISEGSSVSSSTLSSGDGNNVIIQADALTIDGSGTNVTGIQNVTLGSGRSGSIFINVEHDIELMNHAEIISESEGNGTGGGGIINIEAANLSMHNRASVSTESANHAAAHDIYINTEESIYLDHSIISSSALQADAGNITLTSDVLVMDGGVVQASALGGNANAGHINIGTEAIIVSHDQLTKSIGFVKFILPGSDRNVIQSAAPDGVSGDLNLSTTELNISRAWFTDPKIEWLDVGSLIETPCLTPSIRDSKLSGKGRGGIAELPSGVRSVPLNRERLERILVNMPDRSDNQHKASQVVYSQNLSEDCG